MQLLKRNHIYLETVNKYLNNVRNTDCIAITLGSTKGGKMFPNPNPNPKPNPKPNPNEGVGKYFNSDAFSSQKMHSLKQFFTNITFFI